MLLIGFIIAVNSIITAYFFWTKDWWFPETLFGGIVGFEDLILGFNAGVLAVAVNALFFQEKIESNTGKNADIILSTCLLFLACMFLSFYVFEIHSFTSSVVSILISMGWIFINSNISPFRGIIFGCVYSILYIPMYFFILLINPQWIWNTWDLNLLSGKVLFGFIPIEELIFWFLFGVIFKQIYTAWKQPQMCNRTLSANLNKDCAIFSSSMCLINRQNHQITYVRTNTAPKKKLTERP